MQRHTTEPELELTLPSLKTPKVYLEELITLLFNDIAGAIRRDHREGVELDNVLSSFYDATDLRRRQINLQAEVRALRQRFDDYVYS